MKKGTSKHAGGSKRTVVKKEAVQHTRSSKKTSDGKNATHVV
jgi:hypothetical protein